MTDCGDNGLPKRPSGNPPTPNPIDTVAEDTTTYLLPNIDLSTWKVTLPIGNPTEVKPPEILNYTTNDILKPFMYNDSTDGSIVFYTYPGASTANSSYSRTELRELMDGSNSSVNWTFAQGGKMKGMLSVPEISKDDNTNPHRTIIMQIHGRLTNEQRDLIGEDDNNAPPVLKIYWVDGRVRVKTKVLKDINVSYEEMLSTDAWKDDEGKYFSKIVGTEKFTLEVIASEGKMEVSMIEEKGEKETFVYDGVHMKKWGVFENYFKAGNYLITKDNDAFSYVKYYTLEVTH